jgi:hypothetical protein
MLRVVAGRGLYALPMSEHIRETPPYTLPREGIAQAIAQKYLLHAACHSPHLLYLGLFINPKTIDNSTDTF